MKLLKFLLIFNLLSFSCGKLFAADCALVTCVNCDNECDNNELKKCSNGDLFSKNFFSFRPQDSDSTRRILRYANNKCNTNSYFDVTIQYNKSFSPKKLGRWFFFNCNDCMTVGVPSSTQQFDIDGTQIGLSLGNNSFLVPGIPTEEDIIFDIEPDKILVTELNKGLIGTVRSKPVVENLIIDLDFGFDLSNICPGLWSKVNLAIVKSKTNMHLSQTGSGTKKDEFPRGLFSIDGVGGPNCVSTPVPYECILDALQGGKDWGSVPKLSHGKFFNDTIEETGLAGVHFDLGYDVWKTDHSYFAYSLHTVFPTGNKPNGRYVFEPVVGANKSWQIGATIVGNYVLSFCEHRRLGFYTYGEFTHLFKSDQRRVFGLKNNGPGSQLLLLKNYNADNTRLFGAQRVANILTGDTKIGADLMVDWSFMAEFNSCNWFVNLGYNFWYRSKEKREDTVCIRDFYRDQLGIKGHLPLTNEFKVGCPSAPIICGYNLDTASTSKLSCIGLESQIDATPTFVQMSDIDFGAALHPAAYSNKIFGSIGYNNLYCPGTYFVLSSSVEYGNKNFAVDQWSVSLKIGKEF